jgi:hypothetical protein
MSKNLNLLLVGLFFSLITFTGVSQVNIFTEDFQSGIPATWGIRNFDGNAPAAAVSEYTSAWISKVDIDSAANLTASSTSFFSPIGTANRWLISPGINLGAYGNFVSWRARSHDPSYPDNYLVLVSKTDTAIASFTDTVGYIIQEYATWTERTSDLSALGLDNQTVYLAFIIQTEDGFKLYIDDVKVRKDDPVGIEENQIDGLLVKTINPGLFNLTGDIEVLDSRIYNSTGQLIQNTKELNIDISKEKKGIYFLQVKTNTGLIYRKLVNF